MNKELLLIQQEYYTRLIEAYKEHALICTEPELWNEIINEVKGKLLLVEDQLCELDLEDTIDNN